MPENMSFEFSWTQNLHFRPTWHLPYSRSNCMVNPYTGIPEPGHRARARGCPRLGSPADNSGSGHVLCEGLEASSLPVFTLTEVCFCLAFHLREECSNELHHRAPTPSHRFLPIAETLRENLLCVTKKYVFPLCSRPWKPSKTPFPRRPALLRYDLHFTAIHWTRREVVSAEWWELKVGIEKPPFSSTLWTTSQLPET